MYSRWIVMYPMWIIMCCNHLSHKILVEKYNYLCIDFSHSDSKIIQLIATVLKIVLFSEAFCSLWPFQTGGCICWGYTSEATAINKGQYQQGCKLSKQGLKNLVYLLHCSWFAWTQCLLMKTLCTLGFSYKQDFLNRLINAGNIFYSVFINLSCSCLRLHAAGFIKKYF